jgi:hypothetical protein
MKLYFSRAELLLRQSDGEYVLEMAGKELARFKQEHKAITEYNRIRAELEDKLPAAEVSAAERRATLERYLADNLVGHNSWLAPKKKLPKTRIHHT